jgi:hypothetical protein
VNVFVSTGIIEKSARAIVRVIVLTPTSTTFVVYKVRVVPESVRKLRDGEIV